MSINLKQPPHIVLPGVVLDSTIMQPCHVILFTAFDLKGGLPQTHPKENDY